VAVVAVVHVGDPGEARAEAVADRLAAGEPRAVRVRAAGRLEHAVVGEEAHDPVEIVAVERVEQAL
jgi:hypothetical protein